MRSFNRTGLFHPSTYWEMAVESCQKWAAYQDEITKLEGMGGEVIDGFYLHNEFDNLSIVMDKLKKETILSVILLNSFLEAYFFEYVAITEGQNFAEKYVERMNLKTKIVLSVRLVTGVDIDTSKSYWGDLGKLISWRNEIIHPQLKDGFRYADRLIENEERRLRGERVKDIQNKFPEVTKYYNSVMTLFKELDRIDPEGSHLFMIDPISKIFGD